MNWLVYSETTIDALLEMHLRPIQKTALSSQARVLVRASPQPENVPHVVLLDIFEQSEYSEDFVSFFLDQVTNKNYSKSCPMYNERYGSGGDVSAQGTSNSPG